ncbi:MAG: hypothetical protein AAB919_02130 [Patescibacteria group bacterium]
MCAYDRRIEQRFFEAFLPEYPKPYWLVGLQRAADLLDVRGVDAIAQVKYPGSGDLVRVPVQIKGDQSKVDEYYTLHPDAFRARVIVVVVWRDSGFGLIRERVYDQIAARRAGNVRYDEYLAKLQRTPITRRVRQLVEKISSRHIHAHQNLQAAR